MMTTDLQQQMQRDLGFLKQAFPRLQEQFPDGEWTVGGGDGFYRISFEIPDRLEAISLLGVDYDEDFSADLGMDSYAVNLPFDEGFKYFPTVYDAAEFIGRVSHGLTPIKSSAAALKALLGGES